MPRPTPDPSANPIHSTYAVQFKMDSQVQNEPTMQYGHLPERRDSNIDSNGSTPFQSHPSLGQALGPHLSGPNAAYTRPGDNFRNISTSPPDLPQNGGPSQAHAGPSTSHSPLFAVTSGQGSPGMKRKQVDVVMGTQVLKRRREGDEGGDSFDIDSSGQGAKHWTDEEKSKLFTWLMGPGQDEHWNSLRATKNSCLRECAIDVFGSKKTYQALKGCYERNFNLFKQIYAFESFHAHSGVVSSLSEADRLREYERRLQTARKAGCDVGNITARTIDHWHRVGWYDLFYRRWHGDPATTRPVQPRSTVGGAPNTGGGDDPDDEDQPIEFSDPVSLVNGINGISPDRTHTLSFINPQSLRDAIPPSSASPNARAGGSGQNGTASSSANPDQTPLNVTVTQGMISTYLQLLQVQTQTGKMKLEYMRRREEREEKESAQRREVERLKMEREAAEFEHNKQSANIKQKADRAIELLGNPIIDASMKQAAGDYLKKLFTAD